jgi:hypothetical protein
VKELAMLVVPHAMKSVTQLRDALQRLSQEGFDAETLAKYGTRAP